MTNGKESSPPCMILCGPQTRLPSQEDMQQLQQVLRNRGMIESLTDVVDGLPDIFHQLASKDSGLNQIPGTDLLGLLQSWLVSGQLQAPAEVLPNIISLPLTVLLQTAQFLRHLNDIGQGSSYESLLQRLQQHGVQGFCAGLLTAAAIAFSGNDQELAATAGVSLRLAMCIGAYVDRNSAYADTPDPACAYSVRWREGSTRKEVEKVLKEYPRAYISCVTDSTSVTVTLPAGDGPTLAKLMTEAGLRVKPVSIDGRYHSLDVHSAAAKAIESVSRASKGFQYPKAANLKAPLRSNATTQKISGSDDVAKVVIDSVMLQTANWYGTVNAALGDEASKKTVVIPLSLGESVMPLSLSKRVSLLDISPSGNSASISQQTNGVNGFTPTQNGNQSTAHTTNGVSNSDGLTSYAPYLNGAIVDSATSGASLDSDRYTLDGKYPPNSIAVVGMACRFPGADSVEKFWELLAAGTSMVREPPSDRLNLNSQRTADRPPSQFWGNFLDDVDAFDHRFFKKSSREAISWDPEKRVLLEVSYEALESAGYFGPGSQSAPNDYGCYMGVVANNYYDNLTCHPPTAYSMLGTGRGFFPGRVSHQFGLTGPAMAIDTACSSSLVAINAACKAIQSGECSRALAGGTNIFTSPFDYQNLAAGGFLSPTGACKPFDVSADGYCRGEGVGVVVLKPLASAIKEHDNILGVIVGSAVNQNLNDAHITVPCSSSQTTIYNRALKMANADPSQVSYVEAHGTGTQVGDPIECQSIREAFGDPQREQVMHFGSVKGNIGHTEASAGVAGLMKTLLMMQKRTLVTQPGYKNLNPKIPALEPDRLAIPQASQPWTAESRLACVNSYGASGSNAVVAVREAPSKTAGGAKSAASAKQPLFLSAASEQSLSTYSKKLLDLLQSEQASPANSKHLLPDLLFTVADRTNHTLPYRFAETFADVDALQQKLKKLATGSETVQKDTLTDQAPLVLVFGGQESDFVGLSEDVYNNTTILKAHLDECDAAMRTLGLEGLYPAIFQRSTISHLPTLHAALFAIQYSSAKCWIDCGLSVSAVVGHSFGQQTALCVAGSFSLTDGLKLVIGRAELIASSWGAESGTMLSISADRETVSELLARSQSGPKKNSLEIACFNHPSNHVVVGSSKDVSALEDLISNDSTKSSTRTKRLSVTHGFHSVFTEPLLPALHDLASGLQWKKPQIHVELCTETPAEADPGPWLAPEHTRKSVFFNQAINRLNEKFGACTWLEAGQKTSAISLVQSCLTTKGKDQKYCPSVLSTTDATSALADLTVDLWKAGYPIRYWPYHRSQSDQYEYKSVPAYQFEKTKHWLPYVDKVVETQPAEEPAVTIQPSTRHEFFSLLGFDDKSERVARFYIDPESERFQTLLQGHITLDQALAPLSLYVELLSLTAMALTPEATYESHVTSIESLQTKLPIGLDSTRDIFFTLTRISEGQPKWSAVVSSQAKGNSSDSTIHTTANVALDRRDDPILNQTLKRYGSLIGWQRCLSILNSTEGEKMQGKHLFQAVSGLARFGDAYKGMKSISCLGHEAAGRVSSQVNPRLGPNENLYDTPVIDSMMQFAGTLVNYFRYPFGAEVQVCLGLNRVVTSGDFDIHAENWVAYALLTEETEQTVECDIYVFDEKKQKVVIAFLGFNFTRTPMHVIERTLQNANKARAGANEPAGQASKASVPSRSQLVAPTPAASAPKALVPTQTQPAPPPPAAAAAAPEPAASAVSKKQEVFDLLHRVTDVPLDEIDDSSTLADLGIDSLLVGEVLSDIQGAFELDIDLNTFLFFANVGAICEHIDSALGIDASAAAAPANANAGKSSGAAATSQSAPAASRQSGDGRPSFSKAHKAFADTKFSYDRYIVETKADRYVNAAYPKQRLLVLAYVAEAFAKLGCDLSKMKPGDVAPHVQHQPRYKQLHRQLFRVLEDGGYVTEEGEERFIRTSTPVDPTPAQTHFEEIIPAFPEHANVHRLVQTTGSVLAECLTGEKDGLQVVFGNKASKDNIEDVYETWPVVLAGALALGDFFDKAMANPDADGKFRILEVGAGTCGTTKYLIPHLKKLGVPFEYVCTDISPSLVTAAKRRFKNIPEMQFAVLDIENEPPPDWIGSFHAIVSVDCIHATKNLVNTCSRLRRLLRDDGVMGLLEITTNMFWLDITVGFFDGWWLFDDGRDHAITPEWRWKQDILKAGFGHVDWSDGEQPEAKLVRVIYGFAEPTP